MLACLSCSISHSSCLKFSFLLPHPLAVSVLQTWIFRSIPEAQWTQSMKNAKNITLRHSIVKLLKIKNKEKILKVPRGGNIHYRQEKNDKNYHWFFTRNSAIQKTMDKILSTLESISSENILEKWRPVVVVVQGIQGIFWNSLYFHSILLWT